MMCLLCLISSMSSVQAAPGDLGINFISEGDSYVKEVVYSETNHTRQYRSEGSHDMEYSEGMLSDITVNITEVNLTLNQIYYRYEDYYSTSNIMVSNSSEWIYVFVYEDNDGDNLMDSVVFGSGGWMGYYQVIAGTWETFTDNMDDLQQDLEWAKGNVSTFDYSLNIDDTGQKIEITIEYQMEDLPWSGTDESVIYNVRQTFKLDYDDFVLSRYERTNEVTLNSIENEAYLKNNDLIITVDYLYSYSTKFKTPGESSGIPGYEIYSLIGVSAIAIFSIAYIIKRKRIFN